MFDKFKEVLGFRKAGVLLYGAEDIYNTKLASALLRYRTNDIALILGEKTRDFYKNMYATLDVSLPDIKSDLGDSDIDVLIIGLMLPSGNVPEIWINAIKTALHRGINIINPLHVNFAEKLKQFGFDEESVSNKFINSFKGYKGKIYNIREVEVKDRLFSLDVLKTKAKRVLTVGTDCNVGKMLTTLELYNVAKRRGVDAGFIATGQIGMLVSGKGIPVDNVISDFLPAYVEELILEERNRDVVFVEGQGSILQPLYSAVSLGLLHGSAPDYMILTHALGRTKLRYTNIQIPSIDEAIYLHQKLAKIVNPTAKVVGISLNTYGLSVSESERIIKELENRYKLPVTDPVKFSNIDKLLAEVEF